MLACTEKGRISFTVRSGSGQSFWEIVKETGFMILLSRRTRLLSGENIIWKQSGMIHSAAKIISFCRMNTKAEK